MMKNALNVSRRVVWTVHVALAIRLIFMATDLQAQEGEDAVQISSVRTYSARQIQTGEKVGYFILVQAHVRMSQSTWERIDVRRTYPIVLTARLEVNGRQYLPCGGSLGNLAGAFPLGVIPSLEEAGEPIWPIFYIPEGNFANTNRISLLMVVQVADGRWPDSPEVSPVTPITRATIPWTQELIDKVSVARAEFIGVEFEEKTDNTKSMGTTRTLQAVRLRLPKELLRVTYFGKIYCGSEGSEDVAFGAPLVARFGSPVDALSCQWELRFPDFGVKLLIDVTKQ